MVAYDYSKEPNNPWDAATWNPSAQIDFMRRTRGAWNFNKTAEARIGQRIAQSDTKGVPPPLIKKKPPFQVIVEKRFIGSQTPATPVPVTLGFAEIGAMHPGAQFPLAISPQAVTFPSTATPSQAGCLVPPTDNATMTLELPSGEVICTVEFAAGDYFGTFSWASPTVLIPAGTILYVIAGSDPTLADVSIAFIGVPS
jgi:hypothetical protein